MYPFKIVQAGWPHGLCTRFQIERSEHWLRTLQSHRVSQLPGGQMSNGQFHTGWGGGGGGNPVMD